MIECSGESSNIGNDSSSDNKDWLISGNTVVLHVDQNVLDISNILVDFVTAMDQHDEWDVVGREIFVEGITEELLDLVVNNSNTSTKWLVDLSQDWVGWLQDTSGDLDGGGDVGAHDSFDGLRIWRGHGASIAVSIDTGWVDRVRIDGFKSDIIIKIFLRDGNFLLGHVVLESYVTQFSFGLEKFLTLFFGVKRKIEVVTQVSEQEGVVSEGKVGEVLKLLGSSKHVKVLLEGFSKLFVEDRES